MAPNDNRPPSSGASSPGSNSKSPSSLESEEGLPVLLVTRLRSAKGDADKGERSSTDLYTAPKRSNPDDAGIDLTACNHSMIYPGRQARIPHNVAVAIPEGFYGLIVPRSSTLQEKGLIVLPGVIDPGYRGELQTVVFNTRRDHASQVVAGERLSQLLLIPFVPAVVREAKSLPAGTRGEAGFGSTGGFLGKDKSRG